MATRGATNQLFPLTVQILYAINAHACTHNASAMHTCYGTYAHERIRTNAYIRTYTHVHIHTRIYARTHTHVRIRTRVYARTHTHYSTSGRGSSPSESPNASAWLFIIEYIFTYGAFSNYAAIASQTTQLVHNQTLPIVYKAHKSAYVFCEESCLQINKVM